jgi:hypothetical protein
MNKQTALSPWQVEAISEKDDGTDSIAVFLPSKGQSIDVAPDWLHPIEDPTDYRERAQADFLHAPSVGSSAQRSLPTEEKDATGKDAGSGAGSKPWWHDVSRSAQNVIKEFLQKEKEEEAEEAAREEEEREAERERAKAHAAANVNR